jgi:hypothetical protein
VENNKMDGKNGDEQLQSGDERHASSAWGRLFRTAENERAPSRTRRKGSLWYPQSLRDCGYPQSLRDCSFYFAQVAAARALSKSHLGHHVQPALRPTPLRSSSNAKVPCSRPHHINLSTRLIRHQS